jgi:hypothetical protein
MLKPHFCRDPFPFLLVKYGTAVQLPQSTPFGPPIQNFSSYSFFGYSPKMFDIPKHQQELNMCKYFRWHFINICSLHPAALLRLKFPDIIIFCPFFGPAQSGLHLRHALVLLGATSFQPVRSRPGKINELTGGSISVKTHNYQVYHLVMTNIAMV